MQFKKAIKHTVLGAAVAAAAFGTAYALPDPVDAVWKNEESTALQIMEAMNSASADKIALAAMALEMVEASRPLSQTRPRIAVKGTIAACQVGSDAEVVAADPDTADAIANACRDAAREYEERGIATPAQLAMIDQSTARTSSVGGEGTSAGNRPDGKPGQGRRSRSGFQNENTGENPNQDVPPLDRNKQHSPS